LRFPEGRQLSEQTKPEVVSPPHDVLVEMQRRMLRIRRFDEMVAELMTAGEMVGGAHLTMGQEGAVVGACLALRNSDYIVGTHRSHGHPIGKGAALGPLMAELLGRRTGVNKGKGGSMHLADFSVGSLGETSIVGSGLPIAVGGALSASLLGTGQVALVFFGDGAAEEGTFHESLNLASLWKLPVIFYCENNGYGISMPFSGSSAVPNIADRAIAYAMPGEIVDGQDVIACYRATERAVERARAGDGPSLIEAKTYRYAEHSQGTRSPRPPDEVASWKARDPLVLFRDQLVVRAVMSERELADLEHEVDEEIDRAVAFARDSEFPAPDEAFTDLYSSATSGSAGA
jgi:TPP-dependent pyruvate/acetoin dehydrogenase alpha subunit